MTQDNEDKKTSFDKADLIIRQRVDAYSAALQNNAAARTDIKDELLVQFGREVENLQSQLGQVEKSFGKNDPMARVLREALESAKCRLETRKIELGLDKKEQEEKAEAKKKAVFTPVFERHVEPQKQGHTLEWLAFLALATQSNRRNLQTGFGV